MEADVWRMWQFWRVRPVDAIECHTSIRGASCEILPHQATDKSSRFARLPSSDEQDQAQSLREKSGLIHLHDSRTPTEIQTRTREIQPPPQGSRNGNGEWMIQNYIRGIPTRHGTRWNSHPKTGLEPSLELLELNSAPIPSHSPTDPPANLATASSGHWHGSYCADGGGGQSVSRGWRPRGLRIEDGDPSAVGRRQRRRRRTENALHSVRPDLGSSRSGSSRSDSGSESPRFLGHESGQPALAFTGVWKHQRPRAGRRLGGSTEYSFEGDWY